MCICLCVHMHRRVRVPNVRRTCLTLRRVGTDRAREDRVSVRRGAPLRDGPLWMGQGVCVCVWCSRSTSAPPPPSAPIPTPRSHRRSFVKLPAVLSGALLLKRREATGEWKQRTLGEGVPGGRRPSSATRAEQSLGFLEKSCSAPWEDQETDTRFLLMQISFCNNDVSLQEHSRHIHQTQPEAREKMLFLSLFYLLLRRQTWTSQSKVCLGHVCWRKWFCVIIPGSEHPVKRHQFNSAYLHHQRVFHVTGIIPTKPTHRLWLDWLGRLGSEAVEWTGAPDRILSSVVTSRPGRWLVLVLTWCRLSWPPS